MTAILSLGHGAREGEHAPPLVNATTRQDFPHRVRREMGADPCPQTEAGPTPPAKWCGGPRRHQVPYKHLKLYLEIYRYLTHDYIYIIASSTIYNITSCRYFHTSIIFFNTKTPQYSLWFFLSRFIHFYFFNVHHCSCLYLNLCYIKQHITMTYNSIDISCELEVTSRLPEVIGIIATLFL